jgi:hypothetical protein
MMHVTNARAYRDLERSLIKEEEFALPTPSLSAAPFSWSEKEKEESLVPDEDKEEDLSHGLESLTSVPVVVGETLQKDILELEDKTLKEREEVYKELKETVWGALEERLLSLDV